MGVGLCLRSLKSVYSVSENKLIFCQKIQKNEKNEKANEDL